MHLYDIHQNMAIEGSYICSYVPYVNDTKICCSKHKAIHGDLIKYFPNEKIEIIQRSQEKIVGILRSSSTVIMRTTRNGVRKKFIPFEKNKYPVYLVGIRQHTNVDLYVIIQFQSWEDGDYPYGQLVQILGSVGDYQAEVLYILYGYHLHRKQIKTSE